MEELRLINQMDRMVFRDVISTHEGGAEEFAGYNDETDGETVLLMPDDFRQVYVYWLSAMMDFANQETNRYTNDMIMFNQMYGDFEAWYTRTHMPKGQVIRGAEGRICR